MIITVTLNPALDTFIEVDTLNLNKTSHIQSKYQRAGGKGINISRVLHQMGVKTFATGFMGKASGKMILKMLSHQHIHHQFIMHDHAVRENYKLFDIEKQCHYEINDQGDAIDLKHIDDLIILLKSMLTKKDVLVISGSAPSNYEVNVYQILIETMKPLCQMIVLDTSKAWLKSGLVGQPHLIKPNLDELSEVCGRSLKTDEDIITEALKIINLGIEQVIVSLGEQGAIYVSKDEMFKIKVPKVEVKSPVGAGDALLAGYLASSHEKIEDRLIDAAYQSLIYISGQENEQLKTNIKIERIKQ